MLFSEHIKQLAYRAIYAYRYNVLNDMKVRKQVILHSNSEKGSGYLTKIFSGFRIQFSYTRL